MIHHYSIYEKYLITLITGLTKISCIPALKLLYMRGYMYHVFISLLTLISSFMYHSTEFIDVQIYMSPERWHYLDNIGSLAYINSLIIHFMNYDHYFNELTMNYVSIFIVLIVQTQAPLDRTNIFLPLSIFAAFLVYDCIIYGIKNINYKPIKKGILLVLFGLIFFGKSLDFDHDYLRLWKSFWNVIIGISTFYIWQGKENDEHQIGYFEILDLYNHHPIEYFGKEQQMENINKKYF